MELQHSFNPNLPPRNEHRAAAELGAQDSPAGGCVCVCSAGRPGLVFTLWCVCGGGGEKKKDLSKISLLFPNAISGGFSLKDIYNEV